MNDPTLPLPDLSPVAGKAVVAKFDGGLLSSDGGVLTLREVEKRLRVADRFAACIRDPRAPDQITHTLAEIIRFRLLMIAAGYEDGNDASDLRRDPLFKMALDRAPSDRELCSQPTISRLEKMDRNDDQIAGAPIVAYLLRHRINSLLEQVGKDVHPRPMRGCRPVQRRAARRSGEGEHQHPTGTGQVEDCGCK